MVDQATSDAQPLTLDGGNSSDTKILSLSMRKERSWMSKVQLMLKTETFRSMQNMAELTNSGILSM
jgi:hypothetical protein